MAMRGSITLILGGSRSGKSRRAESLAGRKAMPVTYVATCATALMDDEMRRRVEEHRQHRPADWLTIENRFDLPELIAENDGALLLIDCLTLWLSHGWTTCPDETRILAELDRALQTAAARDGALILVSNELGMGLVPTDAQNRGFRDLCGRANQVAAAYAARVEFMIAGLPLVLKGGDGPP
jgi:adenosylcobinamide kinase / adenosylcobinamide-phosphate guanylyltransferase